MITNDIADWFPKLEATGVPIQATKIIKTDLDLVDLLDGEILSKLDEFNSFLNQLDSAAKEFGYPVFLRSGHTSAKHDWADTCHVKLAADLPHHIARIIEYGEMASIIGFPWGTWAVRELLPVMPLFLAFKRIPIVTERRYFIEDGKVLCHHPYWPEDSILGPSRHNWKALLEADNVESDHENNELARLSAKVSGYFDGAWSLDWLKTKRGWVAIDMAGAKESFHWPDCEHTK